MIKLQEHEIQKLSSITELSPMQIQKLLAMGLIDESRALDALILYDFKRIKRRKQYKVGQIIEAVMEKYKVPRSRVERIIYNKKRKRYYCDKCAKEITNREKKRGNGKCDHCVALEIDV